MNWTEIATLGAFVVGLYKLADILEANLRPKVHEGLADWLESRNLPHGGGAAALMNWLFKLTFGEKQLSITCVTRSMVWSSIAITIVFYLYLKFTDQFVINSFYSALRNTSFKSFAFVISAFAFISLVPDYFAIWKTRFLLRILRAHPSSALGATVIFVDLLLCLMISMVALYIYILTFHLLNFEHDEYNHSRYIYYYHRAWSNVSISFFDLTYQLHVPVSIFKKLAGDDGYYPSFDYYPLFLPTTTLTTVWSILCLLSLLVSKLIVSVSKPYLFLARQFDVRAHPLRVLALGTDAVIILLALPFIVFG